MAAGFFILFIVALWYVNPIAKLGNIKKNAEVIITATWPDKLNVDVDTWVLDPNGTIISFKNKTPSGTPVSLDRDDLGQSNDTVIIDGKLINIEKNEETVTFRYILPGEYIVSIHMYNTKGHTEPVPVKLKVEDVNPTLSLKFDTIEPVYLEYNGQEKMVVRFTIDSEGSIGSIYTTPEQSVINSYLENKTATPPTSEPNREPRQEQGQLPTQPEN
jgi:hypothetical protein